MNRPQGARTHARPGTEVGVHTLQREHAFTQACAVYCKEHAFAPDLKVADAVRARIL